MKEPIELFVEAVAFAAQRHTGQTRKGASADPYINHPIAVAEILLVEGGVRDPITLAAAVLHDTVEDTETSLEEIERRFGPEVRRVVGELTDDRSLPKAERKAAQIERAGRASAPAQLVKLGDKISNLRDILSSPPTHWDQARKQLYFDWAKQVVDQVRGRHPGLEAVFDQLYAQRP